MDQASFVLTMFMSYAAMAGDGAPAWDATIGDPGADAAVLALTTADLGAGERLVAVGGFDAIGGAASSRAAAWDGAAWAPLGGAVNASASCVAAFDGGGGTVWIGGSFTQAGGTLISHAARLEGGAWVQAGDGFNRSVRALGVVGGELYAGGEFWLSGSASTRGIARWDGGAWTAVGGGLIGDVLALGPDPTGALVAGGSFQFALGGPEVNNIARWDESSWNAIGAGFDGQVRAVGTFDFGEGPTLVAGGAFTASGPAATPHVAVNRGAGWEALGVGPGGPVWDLGVVDLGDGPRLVAAGQFGSPGMANLAAWDGAAWSILEGGVGLAGSLGEARALAIDPATGGLAVGGSFGVAGGQTARNVALLVGAPSGEPADFDGDGAVGSSDLGALLAAWGSAGAGGEDLDGDGVVGSSDLGILLAAWG